MIAIKKPCIEESLSSVALEGGKLIIYSNDIEISSVNVPMPNLGAEKSRDSVVEEEEYFDDEFGNMFIINVYSGMYGIDYSIEITHTENEVKAKEFCESLSVEFESFEVNQYESEENFYEDYTKPTKFFTIKTSQEEGIKRLIDFFNTKNTDDIFSFDGLTQLYNDVEINSLVFVAAGGDKGKISFKYTQGLYGVAQVVKAPYNKQGRLYKINFKFLYFFNPVITRDMFFKYPDTKNIPNIGAMTKGEPTGAISQIKLEQAKAIILSATNITNIQKSQLFTLFPWVKDEYMSIAKENYKSLIDTLPPALNVGNIAEVFANYLVNYNSEHTSTLIGIFGKWGRGKTYFFERVKESIQRNKNNEDKTFYFCKFQPWKYQKQESAWAYLYQRILESYLDKDKESLNESFWYKVRKVLHLNNTYRIFLLNIKRLGYWKFIYSFSSIALTAYWILYLSIDEKFNMINWIIGVIGTTGIFFMFKSYSFYMKSKHTAQNIIENYGKTKDYSNYLGFQNEIEVELCYLLDTYINKDNERLILFIDDLDRCNEKMIIDIIDGLRLVLDNESINARLTIITAIDERILQKSIKHKYLDNQISSDVGAKEYIEKFFLLGIKLNHLNDTDIVDIVDVYAKELNKSNNPSEKITTKDIIQTDKIEKNTPVTHTSEVVTEIFSDGETSRIHTDGIDSRYSLVRKVENKLHVLNEDEINSIKTVLKKYSQLTPRKINIIIHRYLIFKSLVFLVMDEIKYDKFDQKMLIELVITSQKKKDLQKYIKHYIKNTDDEIPIPLDDFATDKINREEYIILIKFAEMVSPF